MVTLKLEPREATLDHIAKRYGLRPVEVDQTFGVINVDPRRNLYTILVDESVANRLTGSPGVVGAYSNPVIEPFGPPSSERPKKSGGSARSSKRSRRG